MKNNVCKFPLSNMSGELSVFCFVLESDPMVMQSAVHLTRRRMILVEQGEGSFLFDHTSVPFCAGTLVFGFEGERFVLEKGEGVRYLYVDFGGTRGGELCHRFGIYPHTRKKENMNGLIPFCKEALLSTAAENVDLAAESVLLYVFSRFSVDVSVQNDTVQKIVEYTQKHFQDPEISMTKLAEEIGCAYHVCHVSAKESVALIRDAKKRGVDVTCETAPHYLVMDDGDLQEHGRFKMNPPLRSAADREALVEGLIDGTIDCIATDHAPHSDEEKSKGLAGSAFGVVGLETAFPVLYTYLVKTGKVALSRIVDALSIKPRQRFGIPFGNDFSVWELDTCEAVDPDKFLSKGRATPFEGKMLYGKNVLTVCDGNIVYRGDI
jgi:hypothetical protein